MHGLRLLALLALAPVVSGAGCTCGAKSSSEPAPPASGASSGATSDAAVTPADGASAAPAPLTLSGFSAPLGAARANGVDVIAGLVAADGVVRVVGVVDGKPTWAVDALRGVAWSREAELSLRPGADGGVALVWRGLRTGKLGRALLLLGPHGELRGEPTEVDAAFCATLDGVAWMAPSGASRVMARAWSEPAGHKVLSVGTDRDPALACGDHAVVVLGDGDDDLTAASFVTGSPVQGPTVVIRDADFGDDDERDHYAYTIGDDLGLVRIADSGAVAMRELPRGGTPTPWRKLKLVIPADDNVVAVDGDANATFVVYTHGSDESCEGLGSTSESVRAVRVDRKTGAESPLELAPADCERSPGPFWIAAAPAGPTIAWVERATKLATSAPPIVGVSLRTLTADGAKPRRIDLQADAVKDGGCDAHGCSLAALLRASDGDGMQPGVVQVVAYP
jgi:hypothetical protein